MTVTSNDKAESGSSTGAPALTQRRPYRESSKFVDEKPATTDLEVALQEQLKDDRYTEMRAEMSLQYIEDLALPNYGDMWVPGFKLIPVGLAREFGLRGLGDDDPLEELPLDEPTPQPIEAVAGNLVSTFLDGIKGQNLFDVMNGTLFAQLAANARFDRADDPINWAKFYSKVLEMLGWIVPEFTFFKLRSGGVRFSMDSAVLKVLRALLTQDQLTLVEAGFEALQGLSSDDRRLQIFRRNSVEQNHGTFQVGSVGESANGIVQMKTSPFHFQTNESVTDVLWFSFNSGSTNVEASRTTFVLNGQVYSRVRDTVINRLGSNAQNGAGAITLGELG